MQNHQIHVYYSGRVQGVGFRFTAQQLATQAGIKGWVRNLSDGRVEIVAEATSRQLKEFTDKLEAEMAHYIADKESFPEPVSGFKTFAIKR